MNWYDDYPHIGYDLDGTKIMKPAKGDEVNYIPKLVELGIRMWKERDRV